MTPGYRIRGLREQNEISQKKLSTDLGYKTYTTVSKWEADASLPPGKDLKILAEYFKVTTDYILGLQDFVLNDYRKLDDFIYIDYIKKINPHLPLNKQVIDKLRIPSIVLSDYKQNSYFITIMDSDSINKIIPRHSKVVIQKFNTEKKFEMNNGDIIAVIYKNQLKFKVYTKTDSIINLAAKSFLNIYNDIPIHKNELEKFNFLGKIVHFYKTIK